MTIHSHTKPQIWSIGRLRKAWTGASNEDDKLHLPRFQRAPVWSQSQQSLLLASLKNGYPVGSLLLYERPGQDGSKGKTYLLVDGLQRTIVIRSYVERPLSFIEPEVLHGSTWDALRDSFAETISQEVTAEEAQTGLATWLRTTQTLNSKDGFDSTDLVRALSQTVDIPTPSPIKPIYTTKPRPSLTKCTTKSISQRLSCRSSFTKETSHTFLRSLSGSTARAPS